MGATLEVIDDRTNKNTLDITKILKTLFGNGKTGVVSDVNVLRAKMSLILWIAGVQLSATVGVFIKLIFFPTGG